MAVSLTPPNLSPAGTILDADLLVVWPLAAGGPLQKFTWSQLKTQLTTGLTGTFLLASNNLSDVGNPTTARTNLGLGTAATANIGSSGNAVPLLNAPSNTWAGNLIVQGNTTLGDAAADTVLLNAKSMTRPNMPAAMLRLSNSLANVTGDGTTYTILWDTKSFDRGNDCAAVPTTAFVAPVAGLYQFNISVSLNGVLAAHTTFRADVLINGATTCYVWEGDLSPDPSGRVGLLLSQVVPVGAGQTVEARIQVGGSTKVVGVIGDGGNFGSAFTIYQVG